MTRDRASTTHLGGLLDELTDAGPDRLEVRHNWRTGAFTFTAARCADRDAPWAAYGTTFNAHTLVAGQPRVHTAASLDELRAQLALGDASVAFLAAARELMAAARHERVTLTACPAQRMAVMLCRHDTRPGAANGNHAVTAGGLRRHATDDDVVETLVDGLNLARAMTCKNAAADIPFGGSKLILCADELDEAADAALGFAAYCIDASRSFTGPDMGLRPSHADALRSRYTRNIVGGETRARATGPPTADGVLLAIETVLRQRRGSLDWPAVTVGVQGLGAVGTALVEGILGRGGSVVVADVERRRVEALVDAHGGERVRVVDPDEIVTAEVDVLAPAAAGGVIDADVVPRLRCEAVIGAANNMLRAGTREEEIVLARRLQDAGVTFLVEWQHNVGGVLAGWEEWVNQERSDMENIRPKIERACTDVVREIVQAAASSGLTPTEVAYRRVDDILGYEEAT